MPSNSINDLLDTLKDEFLATLPERLTEIEGLILSLPDVNDGEDLLRSVHSLKGSAGTYGFHIFTKICHQMEDMMSELISTKSICSHKAVDILLDYNDLLNNALDICSAAGDSFVQIESKLIDISKNVGKEQFKILVVEPSPLYAAMIVSIFSDDKYYIQIESDGLIALQSLLMKSYDAVITARELPTLNGEALVSAIRIGESKNKKIKAVLITTKDKSMIAHAEFFNQIINRNALKDGSILDLLTT